MLQDNVEGYRKEIASLRDKGQKTTTASQKHEQTIVTLNEDLKAAKEKLSIAEVRRSYSFGCACFFFLSPTAGCIGIYIRECSMNVNLCSLRVTLRASVKRETC